MKRSDALIFSIPILFLRGILNGSLARDKKKNTSFQSSIFMHQECIWFQQKLFSFH